MTDGQMVILILVLCFIAITIGEGIQSLETELRKDREEREFEKRWRDD